MLFRIGQRKDESHNEQNDNAFLIIGLGNPGKDYDKTRHNVGFDVVDRFASLHQISLSKRDYRALSGDGRIGDARVFLMKPQTYMNLSGESAALFLRHKNIPVKNIIVVADDIALPVGRLRIRPSGSAGGHNGLKSLIQHLHSQEFPRVRVGVGAPRDASVQVDFVLSRFNKSERESIDEAIEKAVCALEDLLTNEVETVMNRYNGGGIAKQDNP